MDVPKDPRAGRRHARTRPHRSATSASPPQRTPGFVPTKPGALSACTANPAPASATATAAKSGPRACWCRGERHSMPPRSPSRRSAMRFSRPASRCLIASCFVPWDPWSRRSLWNCAAARGGKNTRARPVGSTNPEEERVPFAPRMRRRSVARLPARAGPWLCVPASRLVCPYRVIFGAQHSTYEIALGPTARAIYRVMTPELRASGRVFRRDRKGVRAQRAPRTARCTASTPSRIAGNMFGPSLGA
jgi:hypothetical protein